MTNEWRSRDGSEWPQEYPFFAQESCSRVCLSHITRLVEVQAQSGLAERKNGFRLPYP